MTDYFIVTLPQFDGIFNNCKYLGTINGSRKYLLYHLPSFCDPKTEKASVLSISFKIKTSELIISGSLRKWYLGRYSLEDFNYNSHKKAILELSKMLGISSQKLCAGIISKCEIGLNIKTKIPCSKIIGKINLYGHVKGYTYFRESVGYKGSNKELKIYNKPLEITDKNEAIISASRKKAFSKLKEKGNYFLRIEYTLKDKQAFVQHGLGYINTLGDIANNYSALIEFWTMQVAKIRMQNVIILDEAMTTKEYQIGLGIATNGLSDFVNECLKRCKSKTNGGLRTSRSKVHKMILDVNTKFESPKGYNKKSLRIDIAKKLIQISRKDETIQLPVLLQNLRGVLP